MSRSTLSILSSILLSTVFALPAGARTIPPQHRFPHMPAFAMRLGDRFAERLAKPQGGKTANARTQKPLRLDSGNYTIVDEPDADPNLYGTRVFGINESGQISGQYMDSAGAFHAFLATPEGDGFTFLPITVKRHDTFALLLNDKGAIFGTYADKHAGIENSWIRQPKGKLETVVLPEGVGGTFLQFLNNNGVSTGAYVDANGAFHGFVRDKQGQVTDFDDPLGGTGENQGTQGIGINDQGEVSGEVIDSNDVVHGFIRSADGSTFTAVDVPGAGSEPGQGTIGIEIEDDEWMTGGYIDSNFVSHGFLRDPNGNIIAIDTPDMGTNPGQGVVELEHLEKGWAIGEYIDANDVTHGFFCKKCETPDRKIVEFDAPGGVDTYTVISSNRQHKIAGTFHDQNGIRHGFIRNPK